MGVAGQINLAQVAFFGVGAYAVAILTSHAGLGFWSAACSPWSPASVIGLLVGMPGAADAVALSGHRHPRLGAGPHQLDHQRADHRGRRGHLGDPGARRCRVSTCPASTSSTTWSSSSSRRLAFGLFVVRTRLGRRMRAMRDDALAAGASAPRCRAPDDRLRARQRLRRRGRGALRRADPLRRARDVQHRQHVPAARHGHYRRPAVAGRCVVGAVALSLLRERWPTIPRTPRSSTARSSCWWWCSRRPAWPGCRGRVRLGGWRRRRRRPGPL